jgi:hypothetical protein
MRGVMHAPDVPDRAHVSVACRVLPESNGTHRYGFELDRPLSSGMQGGGWLLADGGGRAVLKWSPDRSWVAQVLRAAPAVERIRGLRSVGAGT